MQAVQPVAQIHRDRFRPHQIVADGLALKGGADFAIEAAVGIETQQRVVAAMRDVEIAARIEGDRTDAKQLDMVRELGPLAVDAQPGMGGINESRGASWIHLGYQRNQAIRPPQGSAAAT